MVFATKGITEFDASLTLRLYASEKETIREEADAIGVSMSELVRSRYFGKAIKSRVDLKMIRELIKITGLLAHIHKDSGGAYSAQTADLLRQVKAYIGQLQQDSEK